MQTLIVRFVRDESGATAIEYGLIIAGLSGAIIGVVNAIGPKVLAQFNQVNGLNK
ncbi:MAG: Flp family type IVb pilin [Rhizobiales bacterium]|nr:Flp family type IVb pilin [Hyphomicrobiales bacterium]